MSDETTNEVAVIDGNQVVTFGSKSEGGESRLTLVVASNDGTPEERVLAAIATYGAAVVLYHYVIGAKTSGRNKANAFRTSGDPDPKTQEEITEFMKDWVPTVGQKGGPKKSKVDKTADLFNSMEEDEKEALMKLLLGE